MRILRRFLSVFGVLGLLSATAFAQEARERRADAGCTTEASTEPSGGGVRHAG